MRKRMLVMLRMRMCCCIISGGGSSNRLFTTGGFVIVPPSCTFISHLYFFLFSPHLSLILSPLFPLTLLLYSCSISPIHSFHSILFFISDITFTPFLHNYIRHFNFSDFTISSILSFILSFLLSRFLSSLLTCLYYI